MLLLCKVDDVETAIVGYGPGKNGQPMAIVPWLCPDGTYVPRAVTLSDVKLIGLPEKLQRKLKRAQKQQGNPKYTQAYRQNLPQKETTQNHVMHTNDGLKITPTIDR